MRTSLAMTAVLVWAGTGIAQEYSGGASPNGAYPGGTLPGAAYPGATYPGATYPGATYPGGTMPGGTSPHDAYPAGAYPGEAAPYVAGGEACGPECGGQVAGGPIPYNEQYGGGVGFGYPGTIGSGEGDCTYPYDQQDPWLHGYHQEIPAYGGYAHFRPYNYKHVLAQTQVAAGWGLSRTMPYSQQFWHRYHARAALEHCPLPAHAYDEYRNEPAGWNQPATGARAVSQPRQR